MTQTSDRPSRGSRRSETPRGDSAVTRETLVNVAQSLFTELGYANTSLDAIVSGAEVTKGALYHHFSSKQALFEAVFARMEEAAAAQMSAVAERETEPWVMVDVALRTYIEVVQSPGYRRVVLQDGPSVLGYERYRAQEEASTYAIVIDIARSAINAGTWDLDDPLLATFAQVFFGALSAAGTAVAASEDPAAAAGRAEAVVGFILQGIRGLVEQGIQPEDPAH